MTSEKYVINLFGGPGTGKTTLATYLFSLLKEKGCSVEYSSEFAKELVYGEQWRSLEVQPYVFGTQICRLELALKDVEIVVTDSPILLSLVYTPKRWQLPSFKRTIIDMFSLYNNINFLLKPLRCEAYSTTGRMQTYEESLSIQSKIRSSLLDNGFEFTQLTNQGLLENSRLIMEKLNEHKAFESRANK